MGTEEMEAVILAGVLRRAGADVTLASVEDGLEVEASRGSHIVADKRIAACADQVFDLVALPVTIPILVLTHLFGETILIPRGDILSLFACHSNGYEKIENN
mgnify:CR=1 FL=1